MRGEHEEYEPVSAESRVPVSGVVDKGESVDLQLVSSIDTSIGMVPGNRWLIGWWDDLSDDGEHHPKPNQIKFCFRSIAFTRLILGALFAAN